jgi:hypothetical protein
MSKPESQTAVALHPRRLVELPIQRSTREDLLGGMCGIIRRMTRHCGPHPQTGVEMLCLCDHDERALAVELFSYLEGVKNDQET